MPSRAEPTSHDLLSIYLNDHLTGAAAGVDLFARVAASYSDRAARPILRGLADEVSQDRDALLTLMSDLGIKPRAYRMVAGRLLEKLGRLKLNGTVLTRSPLTDLVELEALRSGIQAKLAMWQALAAAQPATQIAPERLTDLTERAESQLRRLEPMRQDAARSALAR